MALAGLRGEAAALPARAALSWDDAAFSIAFHVAAEPPLALSGSPAWANDCVEAFLADAAEPWRYLELVVDAAGSAYCARVTNPGGSRATWRVVPQEPPPGVHLEVEGDGPPEARAEWRARMRVPWSALGLSPAAGLAFRGNLFRIARGRAARHMALSPTFRDAPPDFHVPARFAELRLVLDEASGAR